MPRPFSASQIERLGVRLVSRKQPESADLAQLRELLSAYSEALGEATSRVRSAIGYTPSARVKNTGTILEKLRRYGGSWLKSIQDLAGMRVVSTQTRDEQDKLVAQILDVFADEFRPPKVIDRRTDPVQGYHAVHVVVYPDGFPIEIQVRTRMQHDWAELFEKLADLLGRGIRYGEPPTHWLLDDPPAGVSDNERLDWEQSAEALRDVAQLVASTADIIDRVERDEQLRGEISDLRPQIANVLARIHAALNRLSVIERPDGSAETEA